MHDNLKYVIKQSMPQVLYPLFLRYKYKKRVGKQLNLTTPITYTEKIQWSKLNRQSPLLTELSDKIKVRDWVANKIGEEYLIPTVGGIYSKAGEIDFESLPDRYVIKTNHGSGTNIIVSDNSRINIESIKATLNSWLEHNFAYNSLELQYKDIEPKIYIEQNIMPEGVSDLPDYKFFCFNGKIFCSYTMINYVFNHKKGKLGFFDREYKLIPYYRADYDPIEEQLSKPENYEKMIEVAEKLSEGFSHVRVDLYNVEGKIYFGEMTFSTCSGYCKFVPEEFDSILGEQWDIHKGI